MPIYFAKKAICVFMGACQKRFKHSVFYDLLDTAEFLRLTKTQDCCAKKHYSMGYLPKNYLCDPKHIDDNLKSYIEIYLTDEVRNEGLVCNLAGFARFLDNASNIATAYGVNRSTGNGFFQILVDTMLGFYIYPYRKKVKRDIIARAPKFYFFDIGVAN